jgi:hypothetical protein
MLIEPLQIAPGPPAVLGRCGPFPSNAHRIDASRCQREKRFETDIALPEGANVIDIPEALAAMEAQVVQPDIVGRGATAAILLAMNVKAVQMLVTPGKQDLQDGMEVRQGGSAMYQQAPLDEGTDAAQDNPQLVDAER